MPRIGGPRLEAPPRPPKIDPPRRPPAPPQHKRLDLNQASEFGKEAGEGPAPAEAEFSGKLTVPLELAGKQQQVQLTALDGVLSHDGQEVGRVVGTAPDGQLEIEVQGKRSLVTPERPPPPTPAELLPYPSGRPETYIKTQFPAAPGATADRQTMIDTVVSVLPKEKQAQTRALLETGGAYGKEQSDSGGDLVSAGVSDQSLQQAFNQVLEARKSPGQKQLTLELVPQRRLSVPDVGSESSSGPHEVIEQGKPIALKFGLSVDAQGQVNGAALKIDQLTRLSTELTKVGPDLKLEALKSAGLSNEWIANATPEQHESALAKLREATLTPGTKQLDLGFDIQVQTGGGDGDTSTTTQRIEAKLTLEVDDQGNVDGKPLFIETALATNKVFEQLPIAEKKQMLQNLGFAAEDLKPVGADRLTDILTRVAMKSREPGEHQLIVDNGPDKFAVGLKVGQSGELEGVGVTKLPPPPKQSTFKKIIGPILTVVSVVFPPAAPFIAVVQAGMAVANGARGLGLVGAVLGGAAGVAGIAGFAGAQSALQSAASVVNGVNGAVQGIRTGDFLGAFSSAVSAAGAVGIGTPALSQLGTAASVAGSIRSGDMAGVLGTVGGLVGGAIRSELDKPATPSAPVDDLDDGKTLTIDASGEAGVGVDDLGDGTVRLDVTGLEGEGTTQSIDTSRIGGDDDGLPLSSVPEDLFVGPPAPPESPPEPETSVKVKRGDTLSALAEKHLGDASRWPELYEFNKEKLGDNPNRLSAGVELDIPPRDFELSPSVRNGLFDAAAIAPPTNESGAALLGFDEQEQPLYSQLDATERAEVKQQIGQTLSPAPEDGKNAGLELIKAAGDLRTIIEDPAKAAEVLRQLKAGNTAEVLGNLIDTDQSAVSKLIAKLPPDLAKKASNVLLVADVLGKGLVGYEGATNAVSGSLGGKIAGGLGAMMADLFLGKVSPAMDVIDATVGLVGGGVNALLPADQQLNVDAVGIKKTLAAGYQNLAVLAEALGSSPERRDELVTKLYETVQTGPVVVRGYLEIGKELSSSSFGVYLMDKVFEYKDQQALAAANAAKAAALRERVLRIQRAGAI